MSTPNESELFVSEENISRTTGKPKKKPRGPPMTPERKAQLLENLKRGRENSAKKRKEMAEAKKAKKKAEEEELFSHVKPKPTPVAAAAVVTPAVPAPTHYDNYGISSINNELKELRLMMKEMKMERETERQKAEIRALKDQIALLSIKKKEKMEEAKPEPKPTPVTPAVAPPPTPLRVMSTHADSPLSRLQRFA
jgi:hypothetical protein